MTTRRSQAERVQDAVDQAELSLRSFRPDEALAHLDEALRLEPGHAVARLMQARVQLRRSRPREVLRALDAHDQYGSAGGAAARRRLDTKLMRAESLAQLGQLGMAIGQLEALLEAAPQDVETLRALASLQVRDGRCQDAVETFTLVCNLDPDDAVSARTLSDLLAEQDPSAAVRALGKVTPGKRRRAAQRSRRAGQLLEAERHYEALLDEQPDDAQHWLEAGTLAMEMGEMVRAETRLRHALERYRRGGAATREAWTQLAVQYARRGRRASAGYAWWRSIRAEASAYPRGWAGLLMTAMLTGRTTLMRRADRALRADMPRAERRALLAACGFDTVPPEFAEPAAVERKLEDEYNGTGSPLRSLLSRARETLAEQAERYPQRADVRYHHAVALAACEQTDEAAYELDAALAINPRYEAAKDMRVRLAA